MEIQVECRAGHHGEQEPCAFWLGQRRLEACEIIDRWFAPQVSWFKVMADDGDLYIQRHGHADDRWELAAFTRSRAEP